MGGYALTSEPALRVPRYKPVTGLRFPARPAQPTESEPAPRVPLFQNRTLVTESALRVKIRYKNRYRQPPATCQ
jgi:hypothetical protein